MVDIKDWMNEGQVKEHKVKIHDIFPDATETTQGYKIECPDCGLQGGRTEGFILFPGSNTAYCHSSNKNFSLLESYALKKKIIRCLDGRNSGEKNAKILGGELFTLTLDEFKSEYGTETYNKLIDDLKIRTKIEIPSNDRLLSDFADDMGDIYKSRNTLFFRGESRDVVEIGRYKKVNQQGKEYIENGFINVNGDRFITLAEVFIIPWTKLYTKTGSILNVNKSMTQTMANQTLASPNFQNKIPIITRIFDIQIPILFQGKLTFPKKGYDERFGSWLPYNAPQIIPELYTLDMAKETIEHIFEEFCFATPKDKIHAIAGFITPFLRGMFPKFCTRTPVFIYMANRERAGKDYCAGCSGVLYEGIDVEEPAISNDEKGNSNSNDEIRKKIMACMIQGKKRFHSANNKGLLNNSVFEGVTTAEVWSDRILGRSENIKFDNEMDYSLSGNIGIRLTPDLTNRARIINLELVDEDANARVFKNPNLHEYILQNRGVIISALYVLVKNWVDRGMPNGSVPFTSFPDWARVCGGIMECAGYDNPCKTDKTQIIALDPETEEMKELFERCYVIYPDKWITRDDIKDVADNEGIMPYMDFSQHNDKIKFGIKVDKYVNRIMSNILLKVDSVESRGSRRRYVFKSSLNPNLLQNSQNSLQSSFNTFDGDKSPEKVAVLADLAVSTMSAITHYSKYGTIGETLPKPPTLPNSVQNTTLVPSTQITLNELSEVSAKPNKSITLEEVSKMYKDAIKKESISPITEKVKTDRELQFYESPECESIMEQCTKEQTLDWIKNNPSMNYKEVYFKLGDGCFKHINELVEDGLIRPIGDGWEEK